MGRGHPRAPRLRGRGGERGGPPGPPHSGPCRRPRGGSAPILAPDAVLPWPRRAPGMECRVELGCVVGRRGRDLTPGQAGRVLFGITIMASWTELGPNGGGGRAAISLGPAIVTLDEQ